MTDLFLAVLIILVGYMAWGMISLHQELVRIKTILGTVAFLIGTKENPETTYVDPDAKV